nr:MAG TPA: hypothetical protein [Caudoviricetes sp.]
MKTHLMACSQTRCRALVSSSHQVFHMSKKINRRIVERQR